MDPITHLVAGGTVAALLAPPAQRRIALLAGGVLANVPDIDVVFPHADAIAEFTQHRGATHSLFVVPFFALALWALALWRWPALRADRGRWLLVFVAAIVTHPLLDACNVYGTQILWPLDRPTTMWGLLFIIDPLFTLPLLVGFIAAWRLRDRPRAPFWLALGAMLSVSYLSWSYLAKTSIEAGMRADLDARGLPDYRLLVQPMPFTTFLWRIVVMRADGDFYEGYYSNFGPGQATTLDQNPGFRYRLAGIMDDPGIRRLARFTHDFYTTSMRDDVIVVNDIRMGAEPDYAFRFEVARNVDGAPKVIPPVKLAWPTLDWQRYVSLWQRALRPQTGGLKAPGAATDAAPSAPDSAAH